MPPQAATHSLQDRSALRRHAVAAAALFAAQAQVEIEDEALALIADFMVAVALTDVHNSGSRRGAARVRVPDLRGEEFEAAIGGARGQR